VGLYGRHINPGHPLDGSMPWNCVHGKEK